MTIRMRVNQALGREDAYALTLALLEDVEPTPEDIERCRIFLRERLADARQVIADLS